MSTTDSRKSVTTRSGRVAFQVARYDATPQVTTLAGPGTPSPSKQQARRHEGSDFIPGPTPDSARVIKHVFSKPGLNSEEKEAVDKAMERYGPIDRCIITGEKGVFNFCHLVERKTSEAQLEFLRIRWGCVKPLDINGPENIVKESPDNHYMLDNKQLVIIPAGDLIAKISKVYTSFYANLKSGQTLEPFEKLFPIPAEGWTYEVLPLTIDPYRHIFRQQLHIESKKNDRKNGETRVYTSTGLYDDFAYPYTKLTFRTHANPLHALWHAGAEIEEIPAHRLREIIRQLRDNGAPEMAASIIYIQDLYRLWVLPGSKKQTADGSATQALSDTNRDADHSPPESPQDNRVAAATEDKATEDPFVEALLQVAGLGGDPFKSKPATEDANPGTDVPSPGVQLQGEPAIVPQSGPVAQDVVIAGDVHGGPNFLRDAPQSGPVAHDVANADDLQGVPNTDGLERDFPLISRFDDSTIRDTSSAPARHFAISGSGGTSGGGLVPKQDVLNTSDTSHVPNTDSGTQASSSMMFLFGELAIGDTSSAPARDFTKRKRMSTPPSTSDGPPVTDDSPTTRVVQSRKLTVNGVTQSTASTRRPISSLLLPSQSESETRSTAQPPQGVDLLAQHTSEADGHQYSRLPRLKSSKSAKSGKGAMRREYPTRWMQQPPHKPIDAGSILGPIPPAQVERVITGKVPVPRMPRIPRSEPAIRPARLLPKRHVDGSGNSTRPSVSDNSASTSRLAGGSGGGTNSVTSSKLKGKETSAGESKEPAPKQRWR